MLEKNEKLLYYYEYMVDWQKRLKIEGEFLKSQLEKAGANSVLDCGCGIGKHVIYLRKLGFKADGCDLNSLHINRARELAAEEGVDALFYEEDMEVLSFIDGKKYDAILTLGNTLASFGAEKAIKVIKRCADVLPSGGALIGQVLNYSSFDKKDRTETRSAVIGGIETIFLKTFHFEPEHVVMITNVAEKKESGWETYLDSTKMYYLNVEFFEDTLQGAGFKDIEFFGGMNGKAFDKESSRDIVFKGIKI